MLTSRGRHNRGESGQMIAFAMAFIALFAGLSLAVLTYASRTQSQKQHSEVTAQSDSLAEAGALYGVADTFRGDALTCAATNSGSLTMEGGDVASYVNKTCPAVSSDPSSLASTCTLCLLGSSGDDLTASAPVSVTGPVAINSRIKLNGGGSLTSVPIPLAAASTSFIGISSTPSGCGGSGCTAGSVTQISPIGDPLKGLPAPQVSSSVDRVSGDTGNADTTIPPGVYSSLSSTGGTLTLASGVYVVTCGNCNAIKSTGTGSIVVGGPSPGRSFADGGTNGSAVLSSPTLANFVAGDVGRTVTGTGIPPGTIILSRTSARAAVMSNNATATGNTLSIVLGSESGGALVYLACGNYDPPDADGAHGSCATGGEAGAGMSIGGTGAFSLSPLTSGPYSGIVLFADPSDTSTLSITGNGSDVSGTVYAASAPVTIKGGAQGKIGGRLIAQSLTISVNGQVGSGLSLVGSQAALDKCVLYDDGVTGTSAAKTASGRAIIDTACGGGPGIADFNYGP